MNSVKRSVMGIVVLALTVAMSACATVPPQVPVQVVNAVLAKTGDTVQLFHGGSKVAREAFCMNTVIPVYRYEGSYSSVGSTGIQRHETGKIKITKDLGDYYVEGKVVEGSVRNGDIAVQSDVGCLVRVTGPEER